MKKISSFNSSHYFQLNVKTGIVLSLIFWIYLILRAVFVPFLHDEIMTYWFYVNPGNYIPFTFKIDVNSANNHVLNSMLTRFFYLAFGYAPFVLRLANLLFIPIYCFFAYKIADTLKNKQLALLFWFCLLFIHSIVEFMALSRGYGMSFALLLGSLWYLLKAIQSGRSIDTFLTFIFLIASVAANLSLLTTALMITGLLMINVFFSKTKILPKIFNFLIIIITGLLPLCFFVIYSFALQKGGALYYGTHDGFWVHSVSTLMVALFDNQGFFLRWTIVVYFLLIVFMLAKYLSNHFIFKVISEKVLVFPLLLIGNIIAVLLMEHFFNVNLPEDRSGFYFYYFFIGSVFFLIDRLAENKNYIKITWLAIPLLLIPFHFVYASNFTHIAVYKQDRVPYRFSETIRMKSQSMPEIATLGSYFGRTLVLAYQNYLNQGNVGKSHDTDYPSLIPDFLVVKKEECADWDKYYNTIDFDKVTGYHLMERKNKLERIKIYEIQSVSTAGIINDEYFDLSRGNVDTLTQNPLFFEYDMDIESSVAPFEAWIVVSVSDSTEKTTAYEYIPLNWIQSEWKEGKNHFHNGQLVTNLPVNSLKYVTYIWNLNKVPFKVSNAKITIKQLKKD